MSFVLALPPWLKMLKFKFKAGRYHVSNRPLYRSFVRRSNIIDEQALYGVQIVVRPPLKEERRIYLNAPAMLPGSAPQLGSGLAEQHARQSSEW